MTPLSEKDQSAHQGLLLLYFKCIFLLILFHSNLSKVLNLYFFESWGTLKRRELLPSHAHVQLSAYFWPCSTSNTLFLFLYFEPFEIWLVILLPINNISVSHHNLPGIFIALAHVCSFCSSGIFSRLSWSHFAESSQIWTRTPWPHFCLSAWIFSSQHSGRLLMRPGGHEFTLAENTAKIIQCCAIKWRYILNEMQMWRILRAAKTVTANV